MATLSTAMTYSNATLGNFVGWAKPFGNAFSTFGWVNSNDLGSIQGNATYGSATISSVQINNGVLQISFTGATNQFSSGQAVLLTGLTTNTFLNNQIVRITNIVSPLNLYVTATLNTAVTSVGTVVAGVSAIYNVTTATTTQNNFYAGTTITVTGLSNLSNNGTFAVLANTTNSFTLNNTNAVAETHTGTITGAIPIAKNTTYTLASVAASVGSTAVYTGVTGTMSATANFYAGATFTVSGFTNLSNNGTFVCTASSAATLTLYNANAVAETHAATTTMQPDATNTVFTAYFSHPDVAPVADTGTATIVYNWNTVTNVPSTIATQPQGSNVTPASLFPIGHSMRWRGAWVGITPIFTNLQTTANMTTISFGPNGHGLDLTYSKGLGLYINGITNAAFTWMNTGTGATSPSWIIESLTSTTIVLNTGASARADIASTPVSAGTASPGYVGGSMGQNNAFGQFVCDVVTYNGDLYILSNTSFLGGGFTSIVNTVNTLIWVPGSNTSNTWSRFAYDIWKSNDSLTSTNPIFFKIIYGNDASSRPTPYFYWGCATDGSGNITTNYNWGPYQIYSPLAGGPPTVASNNTFFTFSPSHTDTAPWESDFSGATGRFSALLWRGYPTGIGGPQVLLNIERSHDNSGNDTDAYWTVAFIGNPAVNGFNIYSLSQSIFKPSTGGAGTIYGFAYGSALNNTSNQGAGIGYGVPPLPTVAIPLTLNVNNLNGGAWGLSVNNSVPVLPVFPIVGYVGNPMIGMIVMKSDDTSDGALITASFYGTSHPYLMCARGGPAAAGPFQFSTAFTGVAGAQVLNSASTVNSAAGIRWE
jgi:hypothetical protein